MFRSRYFNFLFSLRLNDAFRVAAAANVVLNLSILRFHNTVTAQRRRENKQN